MKTLRSLRDSPLFVEYPALTRGLMNGALRGCRIQHLIYLLLLFLAGEFGYYFAGLVEELEGGFAVGLNS